MLMAFWRSDVRSGQTSTDARASKAAAIRRFSWPERRVLVEAAGVVTFITVSLTFVRFKRLHALLNYTARQPDGAQGRERIPSAIAVARLVNTAARHTPLRNTCLHRSTALWWLLKRRGLDAQLRFGARKSDAGFEAHAWVEYLGAVVSEDRTTDRDYVGLSLPTLERDA
jgi:hypothetical protein